MINKEKFQEHTDDIKQYMKELHLKFIDDNHVPTDREIAVLGNKFFERDKDPSVSHDLEMSQVIRGFNWGMTAMRQIIEGNNL